MKYTLKLLSSVAFSLLIIACGAEAKENQYYISVGGLGGQDNIKLTFQDKVAGKSAKETSHLKEFGGEIAYGAYVNPNFRSELAFGYMQGHRKITYNNDLVEAQDRMRNRNFSGMVNLYFDFDNKRVFSPYAMIGVGIAHNSFKMTPTSTGEEFAKYSKSSTNFAWQIGVGFEAKVADNVKFGIGYRYRDASTRTLKYRAGDHEMRTKIKPAHLVLASLKFEF